jgi:LPXTG-site transpeptidase (sortase) family protein
MVSRLSRRRIVSLALAVTGLALGASGVAQLAAHRADAATPHPDGGVAASPASGAAGTLPTRSFGLTGRSDGPTAGSREPLLVPLAVSIPALAVSAPVTLHVGVQTAGPERGLLSAPADFHDLGWYRYGRTGVLVIDGHVGFAAGAGPLAYIGSLRDGDTVIVRYRQGSRAYRVTEVHSVPKGDLPAKYFRAGYDGRIMLITCDYQSAFRDGHFANNVYVIASPVTR